MVVKLTVSLLSQDGTDNFYSVYEPGPEAYLMLNPTYYVVFQYKEVGGVWDRSQSMHISEENHYYFTLGLQRFYKTLTRQDMFSYTRDNVTCHAKKEDKELIQLRNGELMELEPAVIFDNNNPLPGVNVYINHSKNKADLSIDEFESIMYRFMKLDMGAMALQMINTRLLLETRLGGSSKTDEPVYRKSKPQANIFQKAIDSGKRKPDVVADNRVQGNTPKSLNDLL